jgi:enediyne polyketide synthase
VFPAVMGLEAMAQVAIALAEMKDVPVFEDVRFTQPIVISDDAPLKIRVAALMISPGYISVVIRSEQTAFRVNHFEGNCYLGESKIGLGNRSLDFPDPQNYLTPISLNPQEDLYGNLLFHSGRFQRLKNYRRLRSKECLAEVALNNNEQWFSRYLPADLVLGDPGGRDAVIHALQACIPHETILPIGVERFIPGVMQDEASFFVYGRERQRDGERFIYDVEVIGVNGHVLERWEGLQLQVLQHRDTQAPWVAPLLGPYIERRMRELVPGSDIAVVVDQDASIERRVRSDRAIQQAIGANEPIWRRPDGKPEKIGNHNVSVAHAVDLTLAIASSEAASCDIELVVARPAEMWQELLGLEGFQLAQAITSKINEDVNLSATRIWTANECLKKMGIISNSTITLKSIEKDNWILFSIQSTSISTYMTRSLNSQLSLAIAFSHQVNSENRQKYQTALISCMH